MAKERINKYVPNWYYQLAGFGALAYWFGMYVKTYYGTLYVTNVLGASPLVYTTIMSISSIANFIVAPTIGGIVDSGRMGKFGKYRKWLLIGPILYSIFYALSFWPVTSNQAILTPYLVVTWTLTLICGPMILMPYYSLHAKIAETPNQRAFFVARRNLFVNIGSVLFSLTNVGIIAFFADKFGGQVWGYAIFVLIACVLNIVFFVAEFLAIGNVEQKLLDEYPELAAAEAEAAKGNKKAAKGPSLGDFVKNIFTNLPFAMVSFQQFQFGFCASIRSMFYGYYYTAVLNDPKLYSVYQFLNSWMGILATLTLPIVIKKMENTGFAFMAFVIEVVCAVVMKFTLLTAPWVALVFSMIFQLCSIWIGSINAAMFQDTAIYAEWKNGADTMATVVGASQVIGTISQLITSSLYSVILISTGYKAGEPVTDSVANGIVNALTIYPAVVAAIAAVCAKLNPLTNAKLTQYKKELDERKGKVAEA